MIWFSKRYTKARCKFVLDLIPNGVGLCLDIGGGDGRLCSGILNKGYSHKNIDPKLGTGDAEALPYTDNSINLVVMKDSLEHIRRPQRAIDEAHRVLVPGGMLVGLVPWLHPFHGSDLWRFSHLGLAELGHRFNSFTCTTPLWIFTVFGTLLRFVPLRLLGMWIDQKISRKKIHAKSPFILFVGVKRQKE